MQGFFIDWLLLNKLLRLSNGSWACCILSHWVALDRLLQLMLTLAFHICYWVQPWHDQKVISVTLHSSVGGEGLGCKVKRGDGHTIHYMWHVWEGQSWKDLRVPRSYWQAKVLGTEGLDSHYGHGILWEMPTEHSPLHFTVSKFPTTSETRLGKAASGIQWSTVMSFPLMTANH